jgi:predicted  nucleic acid-binding Zn-ribbon protein
MSENIEQCVECGCYFNKGEKTHPAFYFDCSVCGTTYLQRKDTGLWYHEDEYHDLFDEIDQIKGEQDDE